jgi:hypothetical protein
MAKYIVFRTWTAPEDGEEVTRSSREVFDTIPEAQDYYLESLRGLWVPAAASWWGVSSPDREVQHRFHGKPIPPPQEVRDAVVAFQRKMAERGEEVKPWSR